MTQKTHRKYPPGGPREPVYALMRGLGFSESNWSDKFWRSADGIDVSIYGTGSMARVSLGEATSEVELDHLRSHIDAVRFSKAGK
jgi:hypothetical protein